MLFGSVMCVDYTWQLALPRNARTPMENLTTRDDKVAALLRWNRETHDTFQERAVNAQAICLADDFELEVLLDVAGLQ